MICPVCKCGMIVVEYHNIEVDYCTGCKGVWFDSGELELILKSHGLEEVKLFLDNILDSPEAISSEKKRKCPICGYKMKKTNLGEKPKILIDLCSEEHGLWVDGGEITQLIRHLAGEHSLKRDAGEQVISFLEEVFEAPE
ncbi:zf-TFIIB domain-containing protein [Chloroflexota bacterium]